MGGLRPGIRTGVAKIGAWTGVPTTGQRLRRRSEWTRSQFSSDARWS